jgi:DNA-3-methyladenine glycosylase II
MPILTPETPEVSYLAERDWRLGRLISAVGTLEYEIEGDAFEHVVGSVIEQMLSMRARDTIEARLRELCGGRITPESISAHTVEELRSTGIATRKAMTLLALAEQMPEARLRSLASLPDDEVRQALTAIPGIGTWTADMFLIFYLDRPDVLPVEDGAVRRSFEWLYGAPLTDAGVRQVVCSLWHPHSSIAVRYLYRALNRGFVEQGTADEVLGA